MQKFRNARRGDKRLTVRHPDRNPCPNFGLCFRFRLSSNRWPRRDNKATEAVGNLVHPMMTMTTMKKSTSFELTSLKLLLKNKDFISLMYSDQLLPKNPNYSLTGFKIQFVLIRTLHHHFTAITNKRARVGLEKTTISFTYCLCTT